MTEPLDLDAIESRWTGPEFSTYDEGYMIHGDRWQAITDVRALIAEVRWLRAENEIAAHRCGMECFTIDQINFADLLSAPRDYPPLIRDSRGG